MAITEMELGDLGALPSISFFLSGTNHDVSRLRVKKGVIEEPVRPRIGVALHAGRTDFADDVVSGRCWCVGNAARCARL